MADNEQNADAPKQGELNDDDLDKVTGGSEQQPYTEPPNDPM
jgi:hypothetical protein